ncbi:hypothetical protein BZA77DRAFT_288375 [Pyronema omphalodes]|nr:hypothetical protein BZA77DRAFT_288375 [Pyronema omphalodes]
MEDYSAYLYSSLKSIQKAAFDVADKIDEKADALASTIRTAVQTSNLYRRAPAPPPPPAPSASLFSRLYTWSDNNRLSAAILASTTVGLSTYLLHSRQLARRKRRAPRAPNGARSTVLLLSGSPHDPCTRSLATDLERRGFIIFLIVANLDDEQTVLSLGGRDIRPLHLDLLDPTASSASVAKFEAYLKTPLQAFPGAVPHRLKLAGMVVVPDSHYPEGPVEVISADTWGDVLNCRLMSPFLTVTSFVSVLRNQKARLVVLTPTTQLALRPAFHAPEVVVAAGLDAFVGCLRRELRPVGVMVTMIRTGTFDLSPGYNAAQAANRRQELANWGEKARGVYPELGELREKRVRGSSVRELSNCVFDVVMRGAGKTVRVGSGAWLHEVIGWVVPDLVLETVMSWGRERV